MIEIWGVEKLARCLIDTGLLSPKTTTLTVAPLVWLVVVLQVQSGIWSIEKLGQMFPTRLASLSMSTSDTLKPSAGQPNRYFLSGTYVLYIF